MTIQEAADKINDMLSKVRSCISAKLVTFETGKNSEEREKNENFLKTFLIDPKERLDIICELKTENLCEICAERLKDNIIFGDLYVFGVEKKLIFKEDGKTKNVAIYIKFQFYDLLDKKDAVLVVSFHEQEDNLLYFQW